MALEMDKHDPHSGGRSLSPREPQGHAVGADLCRRALLHAPQIYARSAGVDIAVTGVPFDQAVSHRSGTRMGPEGIRKASAENAWGPFWPWNFDPFETLRVIDYGDCFFDWGRKENFPVTLENHAAEIIGSGAEMITLGGDHYITYPLLKAHAKKHGPLSLVHFDAHRDVEPDDGGRIDHGTMFGYAVREGLIDPKKSVQIGIRTIFTGEPPMASASSMPTRCMTARQPAGGRYHQQGGGQPTRPISPSTSTASIPRWRRARARPFRAASAITRPPRSCAS